MKCEELRSNEAVDVYDQVDSALELLFHGVRTMSSVGRKSLPFDVYHLSNLWRPHQPRPLLGLKSENLEYTCIRST